MSTDSYYRARYYDPQVGRFISEDPIQFGGGINFYDYVLNNPLILSDWSGKQAGATGFEYYRPGRPQQPPSPALPGLIGNLQLMFPGSTWLREANALNIPMSCGDVARILRAQGYVDGEEALWGYWGPGSAFWNPFDHRGGWEWRTHGPGFHFRMVYPEATPDLPKNCPKNQTCTLDQFHVDSVNPLDKGRLNLLQ